MRCFPTLSFIARSLVIGLAMIICQPSQAAITLQVNIQTHNTFTHPQNETPLDSQQTLEVILADDYITVKSPQETTIFDFKARRRIVIDNAEKTYVDYSLFDTLGFRVYEFQNRAMLNGALAAAKITSLSQATVDNEHILSIQSQLPSKIDEVESNNEVLFSSKDHPLASWSKNGIEASARDAQRFAMFIRYCVGGHPQILGRLSAGNFIPNKLSITFTEVWGERTDSISIKTLAQNASDSYDLNSLAKRKQSPTPSKTDEILDRSTNLTPEAIEKIKLDYQEKLATAFQNGDVLDAMLGSIEWSLMTGQRAPKFTPDQLTLLRNNQSVQALTVAIQANSKESFNDAVKTLVGLRAEAPNKTYVLKIFEANDRRRLKDNESAQKLLIEVLEANPILAGVYKDLGDLLVGQYDTPRAWRCWDLGRHLAPQFKNFEDVDQFEATLLKQYPEYF
jgi:hypothetical protein